MWRRNGYPAPEPEFFRYKVIFYDMGRAVGFHQKILRNYLSSSSLHGKVPVNDGEEEGKRKMSLGNVSEEDDLR